MVKVLLVDDNPAMLMALSDLFKARKYSVTTTDGGPEALDMLRQTHFDCVIVDWVMPNIDPLKFLPEIRTCSQKSGLIVVSGYDATGAEFTPLFDSLGVDSFVSKTRIVSEIIPAVESAIKKRGQ
jgi:CheY-like chemotaxis protein